MMRMNKETPDDGVALKKKEQRPRAWAKTTSECCPQAHGRLKRCSDVKTHEQ
jgi:hypothetical protein